MWCHTRRNQISSFVRNGPSPFKSARGVGVCSVDCWQPRCAPSAVVMLDTTFSEVVWRVLATYCIRQFLPSHPRRFSRVALMTVTPIASNLSNISLICHRSVRTTNVWVCRRDFSIFWSATIFYNCNDDTTALQRRVLQTALWHYTF